MKLTSGRTEFETYANNMGIHDFERSQDGGDGYSNPYTEGRWIYWIASRDALGMQPPALRDLYTVKLPPGLAPDTKNLVVRFAQALGEKLYKAELKYGYSDGWMRANWMDECRQKLIEHVAKGDPRDVAAYCAFLWHHGEKTDIPQSGIGSPSHRPNEQNDVVQEGK